jgi:biofilm PGA synthesis N-glycosyltransferase PgaC
VITALIPAHNEEAVISAASRSLLDQTVPPDEIIVVADNCTDETVAIARYHRKTIVVETVGNQHKKAGALNQTLAWWLPCLTDEDFVFVMDADGQLDPGFIEAALGYADADPKLAAIGGTFRGMPGGGLVGPFQRNEFARYARDVRRLGGKCLVVTGTAAFMRVETLREVSAARLSGVLPAGDGHGGIYDTTVLTEDNELTFAFLHLGYKVLSPKECTLMTEVMPTWRKLWDQRLRWKRGAVENCFQYGLTRITWRYWGRQLVTMLGILVTALYLSSLAASLITVHGIVLSPFWLGITGIFLLERFITLRDRGMGRALLAATMYEVGYDLVLQAAHAKAYFDALTKRERRW